MLVLTRNEGESIVLQTSDGQVTITVSKYRGQQTVLGVDAPLSVKVLRAELVEETGG